MAGKTRARAGWFVALLYLFCVVAPGVALALGSVAPWLSGDLKPAVAAHNHDHAAHQHGDAHADHRSGAGGSHHHEHDGTASTGPCCAMLCLSTIAADLPSIGKSVQPQSLRVAENYRRLPDKAPSRLYRPPIA
ncbi:hypothetical protein [Bradyrhizobium sp.]|uniref:hypothetical protein n=1 Tax=Bradyrhizobium sp. TaxID=376 RepID=UPI004037D0CB